MVGDSQVRTNKHDSLSQRSYPFLHPVISGGCQGKLNCPRPIPGDYLLTFIIALITWIMMCPTLFEENCAFEVVVGLCQLTCKPEETLALSMTSSSRCACGASDFEALRTDLELDPCRLNIFWRCSLTFCCLLHRGSTLTI